MIWQVDIDYIRAKSERVRADLFRELFFTHWEALCRKRNMLVYKGDYGIDVTDSWDTELGNFYKRIFLPAFRARLGDSCILFDKIADKKDFKESVIEMFRVAVETAKDALPATVSAPIGGHEYENFCCSALTQAGWKASKTPGSGDQGADILAEKRGLRVAIQCKRHQSPIGNKAVQEVSAARAHYLATHAIVVSNQTFTPSARALAKSTGVLLIHHDDLGRVANMLGVPA